MITCKLIETGELFDRQSQGSKKNGDESLYLEPGMMWFMPWVFDHQDPDLEQYSEEFIQNGGDFRQGEFSLSLNYMRDWSKLRDPMALVLPTPKKHFCYIDAILPTKRDGWKVTGLAPNLTLDAKIKAGNYSGSLKDGQVSMQRLIAS